MTNNAYPLLRITLTLLPLALLLALLRLMPFERVQSQGMEKIGIVTLEILESKAAREWTEHCPMLMRVLGKCSPTRFRSASFQRNPKLGTIQYWPRAVEPIPVQAFCRHANARTEPTATIQLPRRGEITVKVLVGPHGQMLDAQVDPSTHPLVDHYAKRLSCHLGYHPATRNGQPYTESLAVVMRFVAEPIRSHTPGEMSTPRLTPPRLAKHPLHAYGHPLKPQCPPAVIRRGMQGKVVIRILVGEDGRALHAEVEHGVHPLLDECALQWAYRLSYDPATRDGIPYAEWLSETVSFVIKD